MMNNLMKQRILFGTKLVVQLEITNIDGERSGKTEPMLSNLFQKLQVAILNVFKHAHRLSTMLHTMVLNMLTTQMLNNVVSNANASIQLSRLTGEVFITRRLLKKNTENPSPNSLRKNALNWLTLSKLMKTHMDQFDYF
jgi:hypothetical protein